MHPLTAQGRLGHQIGGIGPGDGVDPAFVVADPRHNVAVVEPERQFAAHPHGAADTDHDPHDIRHLVAGRHEVNDPDLALGQIPLGFKDQRALPVAAARAFPAARRRQEPPAGRGGIEEGAEAGRRVEARQAQPVDGTFGADQGSGVQIADHCVILDAYHDTYSATRPSPRHGGGSTVEGGGRKGKGHDRARGRCADRHIRLEL